MKHIIEHFKKLNRQHKRQLLQDLSDEYDLSINLDLISSLKRQLSESQQKLGEANSYITELESQLDTKSVDEFWQSLSKIERESYREKIAAEFLYINIKNQRDKWMENFRAKQKNYDSLFESFIILTRENEELKNKVNNYEKNINSGSID
jgi:hypothetical protein